MSKQHLTVQWLRRWKTTLIVFMPMLKIYSWNTSIYLSVQQHAASLKHSWMLRYMLELRTTLWWQVFISLLASVTTCNHTKLPIYITEYLHSECTLVSKVKQSFDLNDDTGLIAHSIWNVFIYFWKFQTTLITWACDTSMVLFAVKSLIHQLLISFFPVLLKRHTCYTG